MSQQINLFNPIFLKQKKYFSAVTMAQALGLIFVGSAVLTAYASYRLSALRTEAEATTAQLVSIQTKSDKVNVQYAPKQKSKSLEDDVRKAEYEVKSLQHVFNVLQKGDFGSADGYAQYMRAFSRQIVNGVWLTGFSIDGPGSDISIQGRALKPELVPNYLTRLKREPSLQGKSFAALDMQAPQGGQGAKTQQSASAQQRAATTYIDFSLQSSSAVKEKRADQGAKSEPFATATAYLETMRAFGAAKEQTGSAGAKSK
jgi:Tfp pilus assembly protein PilN